MGLVGLIIALLAAIPLIAIFVSIVQWALLRYYMPKITRGWLITTGIGSASGIVAALTIGENIAGWAAFGGIVGSAQWLVLRRQVAHPGWWIIINILAGATGGIVGELAVSITWNTRIVSTIGLTVSSIFIPPVTASLLTGFALAWLADQPTSPSTSPASNTTTGEAPVYPGKSSLYTLPKTLDISATLGKLLGLPMLLIGVYLTLGIGQEWLTWAALQISGQATEATIIERKHYFSDDTIDYYFEYEYWVDTRRYVEEWAVVSPQTYGQYQDGSPITVQYLAFFPAVSRIQGNTYVRQTAGVWACWWNLITLELILAIAVSMRPPQSERTIKLISAAQTGGWTAILITFALLLAELATKTIFHIHLPDATPIFALFAGLVIGLTAATLTWE